MAVKALKQSISISEMQRMIHRWKAKGITDSATLKLLDLYLGLTPYMTAEGIYPMRNLYQICRSMKTTHTTALLENIMKCGSFGLIRDESRTHLLGFYSPLWCKRPGNAPAKAAGSVAGFTVPLAGPATPAANPATTDDSILYNINNIYLPEDSLTGYPASAGNGARNAKETDAAKDSSGTEIPETSEILSGTLGTSEIPSRASGTSQTSGASETPEILSGTLGTSSKVSGTSQTSGVSEIPEILSGASQTSGTSQTSGASETSEILSGTSGISSGASVPPETPDGKDPPSPATVFFHRLNITPHEKQRVLVPLITGIADGHNCPRAKALQGLVILVNQFLIPYFDSDPRFSRSSHAGRIIWLQNLMKTRHGQSLTRQAIDRLNSDRDKERDKEREERRRKLREFRPVSPFEWKEPPGDIRYYDDPVDGKVEIPRGAPPRPADTAIWNVLSEAWVDVCPTNSDLPNK